MRTFQTWTMTIFQTWRIPTPQSWTTQLFPPVPDSATPSPQSLPAQSTSAQSLPSVQALPAAQSLPTSWSSQLKRIDIQPFSSPVGPTVTIPDSPLEVFRLFFPNNLVQLIVEESNAYAREVMGDEKYSAWSKITPEDIKALLGFSILMGIVHLPSLDDYWKRDPLHYSPIADRISRDRFRDLSQYMHFVSNATLLPRESPEYDRLGKVRPIITYFCEKFEELYNIHKEAAIDEAMIRGAPH